MSRPEPLGDHALGLLDDDAAVERVVELLVEDLRLERGAVLEDGDGGDVGERLGGVDVGSPHLARLDVEQVEGADDRAAQAHRQRVHRVEAGGERLGGEAGPAAVDGRQVLVHDRLAGAVAVEARALPGPGARTARARASPRSRRPSPAGRRRVRPA